MIFREKDCQENKITLTLPQIDNQNWEIVSGNGEITVIGKDTISVELAAKEYLFAKI